MGNQGEDYISTASRQFCNTTEYFPSAESLHTPTTGGSETKKGISESSKEPVHCHEQGGQSITPRFLPDHLKVDIDSTQGERSSKSLETSSMANRQASPVPSECCSSESVSPVIAQSTIRKERRKYVLDEQQDAEQERKSVSSHQVGCPKSHMLAHRPCQSYAKLLASICNS